jgi:hypothetical protein
MDSSFNDTARHETVKSVLLKEAMPLVVYVASLTAAVDEITPVVEL